MDGEIIVRIFWTAVILLFSAFALVFIWRFPFEITLNSVIRITSWVFGVMLMWAGMKLFLG